MHGNINNGNKLGDCLQSLKRGHWALRPFPHTDLYSEEKSGNAPMLFAQSNLLI